MGDRDNGLAPVSEIRKIHYGHLRKALLDNYAARGNKSLRISADGEEMINVLKALDDYFGYKTAINEHKQRDLEKSGVSITKITTDSARASIA